MTTTPDRPFAIVTGASSGIGLELAKQFAEHGYDLLLCADRDLSSAGQQLSGSTANVTTVEADLATFDGVERVLAAVDRPVDAVAVNAGFGNSGRFVDIPLEDELRLIQTNITSAVHLAKRLLPGMIETGDGRLLFTASVAATMPGPYYATYAASKSFVLSFSEALRHELADTGVTVTALLPGPTDTEFFDRAGMQDTPAGQGPKDDPAEVAADAFEALMAGKDQVVAGSARNKAQVLASAVLPQTVKAALQAKQTRPDGPRADNDRPAASDSAEPETFAQAIDVDPARGDVKG